MMNRVAHDVVAVVIDATVQLVLFDNVFFAKQFIHSIKRDTNNTENKSLHTSNKC